VLRVQQCDKLSVSSTAVKIVFKMFSVSLAIAPMDWPESCADACGTVGISMYAKLSDHQKRSVIETIASFYIRIS
jgi:hypothetical protein